MNNIDKDFSDFQLNRILSYEDSGKSLIKMRYEALSIISGLAIVFIGGGITPEKWHDKTMLAVCFGIFLFVAIFSMGLFFNLIEDDLRKNISHIKIIKESKSFNDYNTKINEEKLSEIPTKDWIHPLFMIFTIALLIYAVGFLQAIIK